MQTSSDNGHAKPGCEGMSNLGSEVKNAKYFRKLVVSVVTKEEWDSILDKIEKESLKGMIHLRTRVEPSHINALIIKAKSLGFFAEIGFSDEIVIGWGNA